MFDMPPDLPAQVIEQQCHAVYAQYVYPASSTVRESIDKMRQSAPQSGNGASMDFVTMRQSAIERNAKTLGAQAGLYWRYAQIREVLQRPEITHALDTAFDFSQVVTNHLVLYPVIEEATDSLEISPDGQTARASSVTWEIVRPARIVPVTPTWRDYLWMKALEKGAAPITPSSAMMPIDEAENLRWKSVICDGFRDGVRQANLIFSDNVMQLIRDYKGMLRFRRLIEAGAVSKPEITEGKLGVTMGKSGQRVNIDERMVRIVTPARFRETSSWRIDRTVPRDLLPSDTDPEHIPIDIGIPR